MSRVSVYFLKEINPIFSKKTLKLMFDSVAKAQGGRATLLPCAVAARRIEQAWKRKQTRENARETVPDEREVVLKFKVIYLDKCGGKKKC